MNKRSFRRPPPKREEKPKIIIACEGEETERNYLDDLRRIHRLTSADIRILPHEGTDPRTIVTQTATFVRQEQREKAWQPSRDQAWAVFDGDEHRDEPGKRDNWNAAMQRARDLKIHMAVSNPCIEFWYLLHYQDHWSYMTRQEAQSQLKVHLPRYHKADKMYPILQPNTSHAIERCIEIQARAERNGLDAHDNPCCWGIASLVQTLLALSTI